MMASEEISEETVQPEIDVVKLEGSTGKEGYLRSELLVFLERAGFANYNTKNVKAELVRAIQIHVLNTSAETEADEQEENLETNQEEETDMRNYEVRYIGSRDSITHNEQSTPSGSSYQFTSSAWTSVLKQDFEEKYRVDVENAINHNQIPVYELREYNPLTDKVKTFFKKAVEKVASLRKTNVYEINGIREDYHYVLKNHGIFTIPQLAAMPPETLTQVLGIEYKIALDILDDAKIATNRLAPLSKEQAEKLEAKIKGTKGSEN